MPGILPRRSRLDRLEWHERRCPAHPPPLPFPRSARGPDAAGGFRCNGCVSAGLRGDLDDEEGTGCQYWNGGDVGAGCLFRRRQGEPIRLRRCGRRARRGPGRVEGDDGGPCDRSARPWPRRRPTSRRPGTIWRRPTTTTSVRRPRPRPHRTPRTRPSGPSRAARPASSGWRGPGGMRRTPRPPRTPPGPPRTPPGPPRTGERRILRNSPS